METDDDVGEDGGEWTIRKRDMDRRQRSMSLKHEEELKRTRARFESDDSTKLRQEAPPPLPPPPPPPPPSSLPRQPTPKASAKSNEGKPPPPPPKKHDEMRRLLAFEKPPEASQTSGGHYWGHPPPIHQPWADDDYRFPHNGERLYDIGVLTQEWLDERALRRPDWLRPLDRFLPPKYRVSEYTEMMSLPAWHYLNVYERSDLSAARPPGERAPTAGYPGALIRSHQNALEP